MLNTPDDSRVPVPPWDAHPAKWLAALVQASDDAIVSKTLDGTIRTWNAGAERIFGYAPDEIIGRSILTLIPPELHEQEQAIVARLVRRERVEHFETVRMRKDGTRIQVSLSVSPICDDEDAVLGAAKIARDVTHSNAALQRAMDAARDAREHAERASLAKSRFLATMSHELRTPLNAIGGYVDLLELGIRGELREDQLADLERIKLNQRTLLRLINDVLDFAKLESGRFRFTLAPLRVDELLCTLESFVSPLLRKKGLDYHFQECGPDAVAYADGDKVQQIMLNLLSNALKFTDEGRIAVRCISLADTLEVEVTDTGRGIPPELHETIFEPFVQGEQQLTRTAAGTGLGLAISRELARGMGGDVLVRSRPGRGSTFTLVLPRVKGISTPLGR
ncbi:MAG TPA: PAS domain-containing sensor histidine kinase [Gemmatimonadaceae bacterium]|nr:PAS domain-containing sensor histidine kinase [Gemmatimonadaceae bacterium]